MNKSIKSIKILEKESAKGSKYSVIEVQLINDKSFNVFLDQATKDLIDCIGSNNVKLDYVEKVSKENSKYNAIELKIPGDTPEEDYVKLYFIDKAYQLMIKQLSKVAK